MIERLGIVRIVGLGGLESFKTKDSKPEMTHGIQKIANFMSYPKSLRELKRKEKVYRKCSISLFLKTTADPSNLINFT